MRKIVWILGFLFLPFAGCDGDSSDGATGLNVNPITSPAADALSGSSLEDSGQGEGLTDTATGGTVADTLSSGADGDGGEPSLSDASLADAASTSDDGEVLESGEDVSGAQDTAEVEEEDTFSEPDVAGVEPDAAGGEPDVETGAKDLTELDLNGTLPSSALSVPTFLAENSDGGSRTEADLMGKPTVMWFFPFAGTPG